jgi:aminoglycoside phosphotransferase
MYIEKTETEYEKLVEGFPKFKALTSQNIVYLNNVEYKNFNQIWPKIKEIYEDKLVNASSLPSVIHGDFCFSNILVGFLPNDQTILKFVDPRGKFGSLSVYGDPYYDFAKLMHSTDANNFSLSYENNNKEIVDKIFNEQIYSKYDLERIKLIQATIYIGMCARHYDSEQRQLAMYLSGVRLLNELIN